MSIFVDLILVGISRDLLQVGDSKNWRGSFVLLPTMSKPFQPISDVLSTSSKHKHQSYSDIYGEPENFLEIEVCMSEGVKWRDEY